MKKAIFIGLLFPLLINAQINSEKESSIIDTIYYEHQHGMFKTACFVEKLTPLKARIWEREVYTLEGVLLAKGKIQLIRKKFKKPVQGNFVLIDKWIYYDEDGLIKKERDYKRNMQFPESIRKEVSPNIYREIW
jgi:hypothetical protein